MWWVDGYSQEVAGRGWGFSGGGGGMGGGGEERAAAATAAVAAHPGVRRRARAHQRAAATGVGGWPADPRRVIAAGGAGARRALPRRPGGGYPRHAGLAGTSVVRGTIAARAIVVRATEPHV